MPNIGLIVAVRAEVPYVLKDTADIYQIGDNAIKVAVSGIGPKKARRASQQVCTGSLGFHPDLLINSGFCGAVGNELDIGHLIIADRLSYLDREIKLENWAIEKVVTHLVGSDCHVGKLQTFNWPVLSRARVSRDTLGVDMESFAVAQIAAKYQIPVIIIRAVSDIVPQHAGLLSLLNLVRSLKFNTEKARARLSVVVKKILEEQFLFCNTQKLRQKTP